MAVINKSAALVPRIRERGKAMLLHAGASPWETVRFTLEVFARGKYARMLFSHRDKNPSNYGKPLLPLQPLDATASEREPRLLWKEEITA